MVESLDGAAIVAVAELLFDEANMVEDVVCDERLFVGDVLLLDRAAAVRLHQTWNTRSAHFADSAPLTLNCSNSCVHRRISTGKLHTNRQNRTLS